MRAIDFLKEYHRNSERYYPLIDHANRIFPKRNEEYGDWNIGWSCGLLDARRPYFMECWAVDGITLLTIFISTRDFENIPPEDLDALLEERKIYHKLPNSRKPQVKSFTDDSGNSFYSVNVVVGDEESTYVDDSAGIYSFAILNEYNRNRAGGEKESAQRVADGSVQGAAWSAAERTWPKYVIRVEMVREDGTRVPYAPDQLGEEIQATGFILYTRQPDNADGQTPCLSIVTDVFETDVEQFLAKNPQISHAAKKALNIEEGNVNVQ